MRHRHFYGHLQRVGPLRSPGVERPFVRLLAFEGKAGVCSISMDFDEEATEYPACVALTFLFFFLSGGEESARRFRGGRDVEGSPTRGACRGECGTAEAMNDVSEYNNYFKM